MGNLPPDDIGIYGPYDAAREAEDEAASERRWRTPALVGVKTAVNDPTILIAARVGGSDVTADAVQGLLRPPSHQAEFRFSPDSPWVDGDNGPECDRLGAVPYLTGRLMECKDQELYIWATSSMELRGDTTFHAIFPVVDFGANLVRAFEITGKTTRELTAWPFDEFADPNWRRRGHPLQLLDPEFVKANHITLAPEWAVP